MSSEADTGVTTAYEEEPKGIGVMEIAIAAVAGLAGMLAMMPIFWVAYIVGAIELSAFAGLATIVNLGPSFPIGLFIFIGGGMTTLPLLFITLGNYLPPAESIPLRGVTFATIMWAGFSVAFYTAQTGATFAIYLALTLIAHWVYGYVLGYVYSSRANIAVYEV
ncbi:DUF6789 family protein [Haloferacaceae archaeon DSL9]